MLMIGIASVWAEVEAPTMPASVAPESGGTYYLYNVESDMFLTNTASSESYVGLGFAGRAVEVIPCENGSYQLSFPDSPYSDNRIYSNAAEYVRTYGSPSSAYGYWTITASGTSYLIQRAPQNTSYYNADQYLGWAGETSDYVYANRTSSDAIHWQFIPANDNTLHYMAERRLYEQINNVQGLTDSGYCTTAFSSLYTNRSSASSDALNEAANQLSHALGMTTGYQAPDWNERPILFYPADGEFGDGYSYTWALPNNIYTSGSYFMRYLENKNEDQISSLSATVSVTEKSVFVYELQAYRGLFDVYVDGQLTRKINGYLDQAYGSFSQAGSHDRFFEDLEPGMHTITWTATMIGKGDSGSGSTNSFYVYNVGCMAVPQITVDLLEPGSMGTEVLYQTDHIKNVRRLKVRGKMNDDDWKKIQMMSYLYELDLSEAETPHVPESQFDGAKTDNAASFLRTVILPESVETIESYAFRDTYIENFSFPQSCTKIGEEAFYNSHIKEAVLSNDLEELGDNNYPNTGYNGVFGSCHQLEKVSLGNKIKSINSYNFSDCTTLKEVIMPDCLNGIYKGAFYNCCSLKLNELPQNIQYIGANSFQNCSGITSVVLPRSVTTLGASAFSGCDQLTYAEVGVELHALNSSIFAGCTALNTLRINSPTVATRVSGTPLNDAYRANITLQVPAFAVNNYKLDQYWYNYKVIEGFETEDVAYWPIHGDIVLNRERFGGCPSIKLFAGNSLKINGDTQQQFDNVEVENNAGLLSNCDNLTVNGDLTVWYQMGTASKNKNSWHFTSLPFDMKVGDIDTNGAQLAVRVYDGANRAANGATGSWTKLTADDVIPAGTGFIFQTDQNVWVGFKAMDNDTKQYIVSPNEFVKALAANESATASNAGWNLVGNPYQCYYNDHMLNFTGPITVWNGSSYTAYSITDDDYAIRPNEAFFVQCPENVSSISFPTQGRQLTDVIESQNAAPSLRTAAAGMNRCLIDLTVSRDSLTDRTRVVLNEQATLGYELTRDASKFMSMDNSVPQLYTVDADGTQYAINERPVADGTALVGFYAPTKGTYTFSLSRCDADHVWLTDRETGLTVNLVEGDYVFSAEAGVAAQRFTLGLEGATKIEHAVSDNEEAVIYDLSGRTVQQPDKGVYLQNGQKVVIR